jgi:uncharacterized protein (TIGR02391 family)
MKALRELLPPPAELLELDAEDVASLLLIYLNQGAGGQISRYNLFLQSSEIGSYAGDRYDEIARAMTEAWTVLEREGLIAPEPNSPAGDWSYVTKRGKQVQSRTDFQAFQAGTLLPNPFRDPVLGLHVRPIFLRGDYDTAVFRAFKEIETRTRAATRLPAGLVGVQLMRAAFHPETGELTDQSQVQAEKQAASDLFAGAMGMFKNPSSHRNVSYTAEEATTLIRLADYLVSLIEKLTPASRANSAGA